MSSSIGVLQRVTRVPNQTKREPNAVPFKTTKEKHVDGILATLSELYQGRPVTSVRIGQVYGMGLHQVPIYLHMAKSDGRAKPVFSKAGEVIRGRLDTHRLHLRTLYVHPARRWQERQDGIPRRSASAAEWFEFIPHFKIFLSTNYRPRISGTDDAIWDRLRLVPFLIRIPETHTDVTLQLLAQIEKEIAKLERQQQSIREQMLVP